MFGRLQEKQRYHYCVDESMDSPFHHHATCGVTEFNLLFVMGEAGFNLLQRPYDRFFFFLFGEDDDQLYESLLSRCI